MLFSRVFRPSRSAPAQPYIRGKVRCIASVEGTCKAFVAFVTMGGPVHHMPHAPRYGHCWHASFNSRQSPIFIRQSFDGLMVKMLSSLADDSPRSAANLEALSLKHLSFPPHLLCLCRLVDPTDGCNDSGIARWAVGEAESHTALQQEEAQCS